MVATFGSLPFLLSTQDFSFSEAFFESMSGITTTGATIISDLDNSPKSILLWRAIMQWLGWNWNSCNGNYNFTTIKSWWYAII